MQIKHYHQIRKFIIISLHFVLVEHTTQNIRHKCKVQNELYYLVFEYVPNINTSNKLMIYDVPIIFSQPERDDN